MIKDTPKYYTGKYKGITVQEVLADFGLLEKHNLASAVEYILRAHSKHETPVSDLEKAIHHIQLHLEYIKMKQEQESSSTVLHYTMLQK